MNEHAANSSAPNFEIAQWNLDVTAALRRSIAAGATPMRPLELMPLGQTIVYVIEFNDFLVELCMPMG